MAPRKDNAGRSARPAPARGGLARAGRAGERLRRFVAWEASRVAGSAWRALTEQGSERDVAVQGLKAAFAGVLAWAVTGWWWGAPMALLAPWVAMLLMESTVYRSLRSALQQLVVILVGTVIAAGAARLTGDTMAALAISLPLTVLLGNYARFGQQGLYAATTALFVLAYGSYTGYDILHRLLESLIGAVIGIGVNALVLPPVHTRSVRHARHRLLHDAGDLLCQMADDLRDGYDEGEAQVWRQRAVRLRITLAELRTAHTWAEESYRYNPGSRLRRFTAPPDHTRWEEVWDRVTEHIRAVTRIMLESAADRARLAAPPSGAIGPLCEVLQAAGETCRVDRAVLFGEAGASESSARDDLLRRAWDAHERLKASLSGVDVETGTSLGGLTAETQSLLHELSQPSRDTTTPQPDADRDRDRDRGAASRSE